MENTAQKYIRNAKPHNARAIEKLLQANAKHRAVCKRYRVLCWILTTTNMTLLIYILWRIYVSIHFGK